MSSDELTFNHRAVATGAAGADVTTEASAQSRRGVDDGAGSVVVAIWHELRRVGAFLASLELTVGLFACAMVIVFVGTLAQTQLGVWAAMAQYFRAFVAWVDLSLLVPGRQPAITIPFPGGWLIGGLLLINLIAAHLVRFKVRKDRRLLAPGLVLLGVGAFGYGLMFGFETVMAETLGRFTVLWGIGLLIPALILLAGCHFAFGRRSGIVLLHAGLIFLLMSEAITGLYAEEAQMSIVEGGSANYVEDIREVELALIDTSPVDHDRVVAIPESRLAAGAVIRHPALPVDLRIEPVDLDRDGEPEGLMDNSTVHSVADMPAGFVNPATAGAGRRFTVLPAPVNAGASADQRVDVASAYVTLLDPSTGEPIDTLLASLYFALSDTPQTLEIAGRPYRLELRFKRTYKPYTLHLTDFRHDRYLGTEIPKNFSSHVILSDPTRHERREVTIAMNEPLRYRGETFYQASYMQGDRGTVLQVVNNPGWLIPYVSCSIIAVGLCGQFGLSLWRFGKREVKR